MTRTARRQAAWCGPLLAALCLVLGTARAQDEAPNEALIQMVVDLVGDADRDMRALGLQQIREEVPGKAATKKFSELVTTLKPEGQAELLEALGDRGDPAALPTVLEMAESEEETVRAAALRAIGPLGTAAQVPLLAGKAAEGSAPEKQAARRALVRLRGDDVNEAVAAAMSEGDPAARVALLDVLAARNAREHLPAVLENVEHSNPSVRLAALSALRYLADESNAAAVVELVRGASGDAERSKAELVLLTVCTRGGEACAAPIIAGLEDAETPARIVLLHGLTRAGGAEALGAVAGCLDDDDEMVRDEAARMLSLWRDPAVKPHLEAMARAESLRRRVLAIRGLVRLAWPAEEEPAELEVLGETVSLAERPEEKQLVLGALGGVAKPESLALVAPALDDPAVAEEAAVAVVRIAEGMENANGDELRPLIEKALKAVESEPMRGRAEKVLESL